MKKILLLLIIVCFSFSLKLFAQTEGNNAGAFLRRGLDSRALALGGAYTSVTDDASSIYWNPAGLNGIEHHSINLMFSSLGFDRNELFFGYGHTLKNVVTLGVGVYKFGVSDIPYYSNDGMESPGNYEDAEYCIMVSAAKQFFYKKKLRFSVGLTTKYLSHSLENYSSSALSFDFGVLATLDEKYRFGLVWQDIFQPAMTWDSFNDSTQYEDNIPSVLRLGASVYPYFHIPLAASSDLVICNGNVDLKLGFGAQLNKYFGLRTGLVIKGDDGEEDSTLPTFGFFIWYKLNEIVMQLDYAGTKDRIGGLAHYVTIAIKL